MRDILTCILLAALIAAMIIVPHMFVSNSSKVMTDILNRADTAIERDNWSRAKQLCNYAMEKWDGYAPVYEIATDHEAIDEIIRQLRQLCSYTQQQEKSESRELINELLFLIKHIEEMDNLRAENIL